MKFSETSLKGAFVIEIEPMEDERGFFSRMICAREFEAHGLNPRFVQSNISFNRRKGTLRGMHFQECPHEEEKLVRCTRGVIYDVIVDLRKDSPTHKQWFSVELSDRNRRMLYIPKGLAHGFLTLTDDVEINYHHTVFYHPESARGVRWDDPAFGIEWPDISVRTISNADQSWPDYPVGNAKQ